MVTGIYLILPWCTPTWDGNWYVSPLSCKVIQISDQHFAVDWLSDDWEMHYTGFKDNDNLGIMSLFCPVQWREQGSSAPFHCLGVKRTRQKIPRQVVVVVDCSRSTGDWRSRWAAYWILSEKVSHYNDWGWWGSPGRGNLISLSVLILFYFTSQTDNVLLENIYHHKIYWSSPDVILIALQCKYLLTCSTLLR